MHLVGLVIAFLQRSLLLHRIPLINDRYGEQLIGKTAYFMVGSKSLDAWSSSAHVIYMNRVLWFSLITELVAGSLSFLISIIFCNSLTKKYARYPVRVETHPSAITNSTGQLRENYSIRALGTKSPQIFFGNQKYSVLDKQLIQLAQLNHSQRNASRSIHEPSSANPVVVAKPAALANA